MPDRVLKKRYSIQKRLGQNAGRQTFLARDLQTQQLVAIKLLAFDADCQWDDFKLFEREAETLQSLSHPAIPRYLDHFEFQTPNTKGWALVQSYIDAKSLEDWVRFGHRFNDSEVIQLARSVLEILTYLHSQNPPVIHRDLKPSNILLGESARTRTSISREYFNLLLGEPTENSIGQVYLVDFGSVQTLAAREGRTITVVGTYGYMPPEQFGGRAVPASDLYGLGATLIYLVTETHPAELPQKDLRIQFKPKIQLSWAFMDWLMGMTEPDLNSRLRSAEQALNELDKPFQRKGQFLIARKPTGRQVQLKKDKNSLLELSIPFGSLESGNKFCMIVLLSLTFLPVLGLFSIAFLGFFIAAHAGQQIPYLLTTPIPFLLTTVFWFKLLFYAVKKVLPNLRSYRYLKIDRKNIYLNCFFRIPRQAICKLSLVPNDPKYLGSRCNIQIWAGMREYTIQTSHLTHDEINWIASELSDYLDLPIT